MRNVIANAKGACYELCVVVAISLVLGVFLSACSGEGGNFTNPSDDEPTNLSSAEGQGSSSSTKKLTDSSDSRCEECNGNAISSSGNAKSNVSSDSNGNSFSAGDDEYSSSSVTLATPCMEWIVDNCEYVTLLDDRDGQTYKTVKIGNQWWMAENLNYATAKGSYCYEEYDNNCVASGRLYEWAYAIGKSEDECGYGHECDLGVGNVQGVCPDGWHVPSKSEWETLIAAVGGEDIAGRKLKAKAFGVAQLNVINENAFGFWAYSAGERSEGGYFGSDGYIANFWSSTENGSADAYFVVLTCCSDFAELSYNGFKSYGYSVRCVKD